MYTEKKKDIDLVLLDMTMPRMSGKKVLEKMIRINSEVRVIILSGHSRQEIGEEILSQSKEFIYKPYDIKELAKMQKEYWILILVNILFLSESRQSKALIIFHLLCPILFWMLF